MSRIGFGAIAALFMSLAVFSYSQQPTQNSGPPTQEQQPQHEVPPPPRQPEVNPPRGQQEETKPPKQQPETKPPKAEKQPVPQPSKEQPKATHEQHGTAAQGKARPAGKSAHIPDPQFRANFGRQHTFVVNQVITTTTIIPNQSQFVVAGFTFIFLDPWPADWLFTDECFIDFVGGEYFLFDAFHPGVRVALFVVG